MVGFITYRFFFVTLLFSHSTACFYILVFFYETFFMSFRWEPAKRYWSTEGFYDIRFDEGKQTLSFRTISFGIFALSAFRFSNLPLQSWELA